jgi:tetratricopeptide (TPR) repeat protein
VSAHYSADDHFRRGEAALASGDAVAALDHFRISQRIEPTNARYRSYFGLCLGLAERRFDKALELCRSAAKEEFFNPALYLNLARVHLAFGFKAEAIRFLRRGLMIEPENQAILAQMRDLGIRRRPVLGFLRRGHLLNRLLGRFSGRVLPQTSRTEAASPEAA